MKYGYSFHAIATKLDTMKHSEKQMTTPALPPKPVELIEIEARCRAIRAERQAVETELRRLQHEHWLAAQDDGNLGRAVEAIVSGETDATSRNMTPERNEELRARLEILTLADGKASLRAAELCERHNRNIAAVWRPMHKKVACRIARALRDLANANRTEHELRDKAPGGTLPPMDYPGIGSLGAVGGPAKYWMEHARRHGYLLDEGEPEADWPAAAL